MVRKGNYMHEARIPRAVFDLVKPAVLSFVHRLLLFTYGRPGSAHSRLEVSALFETGLVTSLYEYLLVSPVFRDYECKESGSSRLGPNSGRNRSISGWGRSKGDDLARLRQAIPLRPKPRMI